MFGLFPCDITGYCASIALTGQVLSKISTTFIEGPIGDQAGGIIPAQKGA